MTQYQQTSYIEIGSAVGCVRAYDGMGRAGLMLVNLFAEFDALSPLMQFAFISACALGLYAVITLVAGQA